MESDSTPPGIQQGVQAGILYSLQRDVELRGGRTARLLVAAGVVGIVGAVGVTLLVSTHPFGHHPPWHVAVFSAVWAGILVVSLAIAFLGVRTPSLPLAHSASVGILGLGLAGICGAVCPDHHFLHWWSTTDIGTPLHQSGGLGLSAFCFGFLTTTIFAGIAAFVVSKREQTPLAKPIVPAAILLALFAPGVALQSVGTSIGVFVGWLAGTAVGAYLGVVGGARARALLARE